METNGDFAIVWQSDETGNIEIWLQRYQANGTAIGGAESGLGHAGDDDTDAAIAMDDDGDFVVAWQSKDHDGDGGIFTRRYDNAGIAHGGRALVNATTSGDQQRPDVAMDADGDYVVVWDREGASDRQRACTAGASAPQARARRGFPGQHADSNDRIRPRSP